MMKPPAPSPSQSLLITQPSLASSAHFSSLPRWKTSSSPSLSHVASLSSPLSPSASFKLSQQDKHFHSPPTHSKGLPPLAETRNRFLSSRLHSSSHVHKSRLTIPCSVNMATGKSDEPEKLIMDRFMELMRHFWEIIPQPIKSFPWMAALQSFIQINLDLVHAVAKYLCVPLLALSSLSEMSFCAQEKKMIFIPILFLAGFSVAGVLNDTATELSPHLKREEFPWHLLSIAIFFILLKLPGPSFPYWARIFVPHFANGGLWRTLGFTILWYRKPQDPSTSILRTPADEIHS